MNGFLHYPEKCDSLSKQAGIWAAKAWWQHLCGRRDSREILNIIMQCREIMSITQILHEQGFDDHMPACHQIQMQFSGYNGMTCHWHV
jgi:hypothetical protein